MHGSVVRVGVAERRGSECLHATYGHPVRARQQLFKSDWSFPGEVLKTQRL